MLNMILELPGTSLTQTEEKKQTKNKKKKTAMR